MVFVVDLLEYLRKSANEEAGRVVSFTRIDPNDFFGVFRFRCVEDAVLEEGDEGIAVIHAHAESARFSGAL